MAQIQRASRPTHFLSFPIDDAGVQLRAKEAIALLLDARPRPSGIDESLAVHPASLHLTLGIMSLGSSITGVDAIQRKEEDHGSSTSDIDDDGRIDEEKRKKRRKRLHTVEEAGKLLRESQKLLRSLLEERKIERIPVHFDRLESFQADPSKCRVLYAEPEKGSDGVGILHELAEHLRRRFNDAGMLADFSQPLTLHCTLMKSSARKKRPPDASAPGGQPVKDDQDPSQQPDQCGQHTTARRSHHRSRGSKNTPFDASLVLTGQHAPFALGTGTVDRVQLCQMGRKDHTGRYIALEEISLFGTSLYELVSLR